MDKQQLKPCPFCGHDTPEFERLGTPRQSCIVVCGNCGCQHESSDEGAECGSSWNDRAGPTPTQTPQPPSASDEREAFSVWFCAESHRRKYTVDHPVYLAASEAWQTRAALAPSPGIDAAGQKPVVWLQQSLSVPSWFEIAEPGQKSIDPARWSDAFAVYAAPPAAQPSAEWLAEAECLLDDYRDAIGGGTFAFRHGARAALLAHLKARS